MFTALGAGYLVAIIVVTWVINKTITSIYKNKKYTLKFTERNSDI